ncbi:hypothetical protein OG530_40460 [Streptomyces decoyicus]
MIASMQLWPTGTGPPAAPEFMLHIHDDGTTGWRWRDKPFGAVNQ